MTLVIGGNLVVTRSFKDKSFSRHSIFKSKQIQTQTQKWEMKRRCYIREHLQKTEIYTKDLVRNKLLNTTYAMFSLQKILKNDPLSCTVKRVIHGHQIVYRQICTVNSVFAYETLLCENV